MASLIKLEELENKKHLASPGSKIKLLKAHLHAHLIFENVNNIISLTIFIYF